MAGAVSPKAPTRMVPVALAAYTGAIHVGLTHYAHAPIIQPDEVGYIDGARRLALGGPRPITAYYPGVSALFAPVWRLSTDPITVWRTALWINSGLCGLLALLTWALIPRIGFGSTSMLQRIVITILVGAYPAIALYSNVSMSESLFAFGVALVLLLTVWCFGRRPGGPLPWMVLGLAAGLLTAVHPRGIAVAAAVFLVALVVLAPWDRTLPDRRPVRWSRLIALATGTVLGFALTRVLIEAVQPEGALGAYKADAVVGRALNLSAVRLLAMGLGGQLLYLTVATVGLAPLGLWLSLTDAVALARRRSTPTPAIVGRAVLGMSGLGVLAMSVLFLNGGDRADQLIYGRYNEGVIVGLLIVGATWVVATRRVLSWFAVSGVAICGGVIALAGWMTASQRTAVLNPSTVLGIYSIVRRSGPDLDLAAIAVVGAVALVVAVLVAWRWPTLATAVIAGAFVFVSVDGFQHYLEPGADARSRQDVLATTISKATATLHLPKTCVGFDAGIDFTYFNDRFYLPGWNVQPFDGSAGPPCGPFAISSRPNFFAYHPGSQIVGVENDLPMLLYVMPGPALETLRTAGWLLPAVIPGPLDLDTQQATVDGPSSISLGSGKTSSVHIRVGNVAPHGNPWPNERGLRQDGYVVRVTARWFPAGQLWSAPGQSGGAPAATSDVELPRMLIPGQHVDLKLPLDARHLLPGHYTVLIAIYQELVGTFPGGTLAIPATVT